MLLTFGHGTSSAEQMTELLRGAGVSALVDVRTAPGSRRHPHVARAELERWLPEAGISYRWDKRLGGFRRPGPDSPDVAWREDMFRGYAEHMRTAGFSAAVDEVLAGASAETTAVMCAESLWWRCHRRLLADYVSAVRGVPVRHLLHDGRLEDHRLSPGLRLRDDGLLVYDAGQSPLLLKWRRPLRPGRRGSRRSARWRRRGRSRTPRSRPGSRPSRGRPGPWRRPRWHRRR